MTLLEVVLVVVILAALAGIAMPRFSAFISNHQHEAACARLLADIEVARKHARRKGMNITITFNAAQNSYSMPGVEDFARPSSIYTVHLDRPPYNADITRVLFGDDAQLIFDGYGEPDSGGAVVLRIGDSYCTISVDKITGLTSKTRGFKVVADGPSTAG